MRIRALPFLFLILLGSTAVAAAQSWVATDSTEPAGARLVAGPVMDVEPLSEGGFDALRSDDALWAGLEGWPRVPLAHVMGGDGEASVARADSRKTLDHLLDDLEPMARALPVQVPVVGAELTSGFGIRRNPVTRRVKRHEGADFAAPTGTPVVAAGDAIVSYADWRGAYGKVIILDHGSGVTTRYAHLRAFEVAAGQYVRRGQIIGQVGTTGRSTGPHLHYERHIDGVPVDPLPPLIGLEQSYDAEPQSGPSDPSVQASTEPSDRG